MNLPRLQLKNFFELGINSRQKKKSLILKFILFLSIGIISIYIANENYLLFHTGTELFSCVIIFSVSVIAVNTLHISQNNYFVFMGIAYGFVGFFDVLHTLAYKSMGVFTGYGANLPTQLWIVSRYIESLSLLIAFVFLYKNIKVRRVIFIYFFISVFLLLSIFNLKIFPDCYVPGEGLTLFKITSEYIISAILIISFILLRYHREELNHDMSLFMSGAIITTILAEFSFTFYIDVYGLSNMLGHLLKLISFYLMYKAINEVSLKRPYEVLFHNLKKERDKLDENINKARKIQKAMLPSKLPTLSELDIVSWNVFAERLGGDFHDVFVIDEEHLGFYLVDVSGHGLDAALMTTFIKSNISFQVMVGGVKTIKSPRQIILDLNRAYQNESFPADKFVSVTCGVLNYKTGKLKLSATGVVNYPIKFNINQTKRIICSGKVINSYINDLAMKEKEINLEVRDYLFLFTDGLIEETDKNDKMYGEERLIDNLSSLAGLEAREVMAGIKADFKSYVGKDNYTDDITCILLKMK